MPTLRSDLLTLKLVANQPLTLCSHAPHITENTCCTLLITEKRTYQGLGKDQTLKGNKDLTNKKNT